ncbi:MULTISPECIES: 50S ribosomal protein L18 [Holospora]|uniref:Large ribosomal subunit protein uL18 n=2 Tax=Holospora TaxID=44747 RepID=A0A061JIC9_9PROT|nr:MULTISPECIES: 50S ribosomal protein L18 [Holospora]ETZ04769.1 50S ribosomal protein L18 [Holospora undulata HU1]GAJ46033.1 50S ribosomal protein L18 [Holospora elegans E1]
MLYKSSTKERRKHRIREKIKNRKDIVRHRLSVFRSGRYIYAQVIDDVNQCTVVSASSLEKEYKANFGGGDCKAASWVGEMVAKRAIEKGLKDVVFDRGCYKFHGRVKSLADSARACGLNF